MCTQKKKDGQKGFSLVELMVVVGIIGILATLAMPRFKQFQAKAKMSEAKTMLGHIYSLQQSYYLDQNQFAPILAYGASTGSPTGCDVTGRTNSLGFSIEPCAGAVPRYNYNAATSATGFYAWGITGSALNNRVCTSNNFHYYVTSQDNILGSVFNTAIADPAATVVADLGVGTLCPN